MIRKVLRSRMKETGRRIVRDLWQVRWALIVLIVYFIVTGLLFHSGCPMVILFGISCPGCGLTRAGSCLLTGDLVGAWNSNATIFIWLFLAGYLAWMRYLKGARAKYALPMAALCAALCWCYYVFRWQNGTLPEPGYHGILAVLKSLT